jgi:Integrase core domain
MKQRQAVTKVTAKRYDQAGKKEKKQMLDEFCRTTGYNRCYARWVLRHQGKRLAVRRGVVVEADLQRRQKRIKARTYDEPVQRALVQIWELLDYLCGKRLVAILPEIISKLEEFKEFRLEAEIKAKLLQISAATADRLLQPERRKHELRGRGQTRPGTLLKHQIPIRTFADWNEQRPGFVELDLVGHDGGIGFGDYAQTLDMTDVCTGWTETIAVPNKAQVWVFEAIDKARGRLPFPLLGIDCDNGSEFINYQLLRYCNEHGITFTRTRPYRKNDNCYVEQKNYSVVRRAVGYQRFDTSAEGLLLNRLYDTLRLYTNFFQPTMKLVSKERLGSRVKKLYDYPRTPYQRLLDSPHVAAPDKQTLQQQYQQLNPAALKRAIRKLQKQLFAYAKNKPRMAPPRRKSYHQNLEIKPHPEL